MLALHLFGVVHFDRLGKVRSELDSYLDSADADALFLEAQFLRPRPFFRAFLRMPLALFGFLLYGLVSAPFYALFTRQYAPPELVASKALTQERDLPLHVVDRPLYEFALERGWVRTLAEWAVFLSLGSLAPLSNGLLVGYALGWMALVAVLARRSRRLAGALSVLVSVGLLWVLVGGPVVVSVDTVWFLVVAMLANAVFVRQTLDDRNEFMLDRATELADSESYESGVLVTGMAHLDGMVALSEHVVRTYRPRWLRTPGAIDDDPTVEGGEGWRPGVPAQLSRRAEATLVDTLAVTVVGVVGAVLAVTVEGIVAPVLGQSWVIGAILFGVTLSVALYFFALEARWGQTVGKRAAGIVVTDADGAPPAAWRAVVRNLLRPVDAVGFYLLGAVVAGITADHQRLGDLLAGTVVREKVSESAEATD